VHSLHTEQGLSAGEAVLYVVRYLLELELAKFAVQVALQGDFAGTVRHRSSATIRQPQAAVVTVLSARGSEMVV
jgi:hypothetical protein